MGDRARVPLLEAWVDEDRYTFEDSDRFEEDSMCSWSSEPESVCNNWRGWKRTNGLAAVFGSSGRRYAEDGRSVTSLTELTARCVASHIPFELVEHVYPPVPEQLQLRIAFWSFPDNEEDIRLYSCLANGSSEEYQRGDHLFKNKAVREPLQIGFHLSATVIPIIPTSRGTFNVAVTFDRRRITSCNCTCSSSAYWCSHVVAVCLYRINKPDKVCLRAPVSESLSRLHRDQLQKFAQYLISELPQQILPTAQRLLDELLSSHPSSINSVCGAPDPTAGASISDQTSWYLDQKALHDNIKKILIKFCVPAPIVFSDVNYLTTTAPPAASEWCSLLRPLRGREPEGMWNLLSIVREMYKRNDRNAVPLLEIITEECMACEQILVWWFNTCVALHSGGGGGKHAGTNSNALAAQHACSSLCDEMVILWRLAALNPGISPEERVMLEKKFSDWHTKIIDKVTKSRAQNTNKGFGVDVFPGFNPAMQACWLDWEDYPLPGITFTVGASQVYHCPFTCFTHSTEQAPVNQVNSSHYHHYHHYGKHGQHSQYHRKVSNSVVCHVRRRPSHEHKPPPCRDGNRSSISSEGFCENEGDTDLPVEPNSLLRSRDHAVRHEDTDSQEGGGSDSASSSDAGTTCRATHKSGNSDRRVINAEGSKKLRNVVLKEQSVSSEESDLGVFTGPQTSTACVEPSEENKQEAESPRRKSNDSVTSQSDSQQSGDEYNVYYYGKEAGRAVQACGEKEEGEGSGADADKDRKREDPWDILFARAEGLHAHGHGLEACTLAVRLALELLANPPNLMVDLPVIPSKGKRRKVNPASHQMSCLASVTLAKCAFLCAVLTEVSEHHHLAFRVGLFGLEMARPPASTKPLEVKLANQESDLVNLIKRIPLGPQEFAIVREKAEQLKDGTLRSRGEALLPIMLSSFLFDALECSPALRDSKNSNTSCADDKYPSDEALAFEAAVSALGLKANVSEADHPLLCEGTRRQRGELAITLLVHYKDDHIKLARIMDKLLDREVHSLMKAPLHGWYYAQGSIGKAQHVCKRLGMAEEIELQNMLPASVGVCSMDMVQPDQGNASGSRPHSSTSAELEQSMVAMNLSAAQPTSLQRMKDAPRFKGKRMFPSIPNQPSEASAHFMIELAKTVLNKAGGNSSTSLFTQASTTQQHHGPHRSLHICAFQIGLYALGLHNCVSPNWLSRTYSSHVSWITGQAMEIGAPAISFLIDTWEGHLTPPEAASIADRASRGCDPNMVRAAAELALSCLPHAHALNPNEIQRAILQCKEQSELMLEHSCLTVENAAKGGGVYPEVLFQVAKYWYDLYTQHTPGGEQAMDLSMDPHDPLSLHFTMDPSGSVIALVEPPMPPMEPPAVVMTTAPPPNFTLPMPYAVAPYSFAVHHPYHPRVQLPPPPHPHLGLYLTQPPYQYPNPQPGPIPPQYFVQGNSGQPPLRPMAYPITTMQQNPIQIVQTPNVQSTVASVQNVTVSTVSVGMPPMSALPPLPPMQPMQTMSPLQQAGPPIAVAPPGQSMALVQGRPPPQQQVHRQGQPQYTPQQFRCLLAAYRVGMLALETLARRVHDDRPQAKYARNPPYGEDVKWLLRVSKKLGTQYLQQFCVCVVNSIVSPFILHDVAIEAAHCLARNNPTLVMQHLRSALTPLVQKCQQMYIQCMHQKLYHLTSADYEDFVSVVCSARAAFHITPEGSQQFKEWLQSIRRSKSCKKDLWAQINNALQASNK